MQVEVVDGRGAGMAFLPGPPSALDLILHLISALSTLETEAAPASVATFRRVGVEEADWSGAHAPAGVTRCKCSCGANDKGPPPKRRPPKYAYASRNLVRPDPDALRLLDGWRLQRQLLTRYANLEAPEPVDQARVETDPDRRRELYYEIQRIAMEDAVMFDLRYSPFRNISRTNAHNFCQNPLGRLMLKEVTIE
jgi:hypothetical protein